MVSLNLPYLAIFWSLPMIEVNLLIFMYLAGALCWACCWVMNARITGGRRACAPHARN